MNQSQLEGNTRRQREARESVCKRVTIAFGFDSEDESFLGQSLYVATQNQRKWALLRHSSENDTKTFCKTAGI